MKGYNSVDGLKSARVLIDSKYLKEHCCLYKGHTVWIKSTDYNKSVEPTSYQVVRPNALGELTFFPHELILDNE